MRGDRHNCRGKNSDQAFQNEDADPIRNLLRIVRVPELVAIGLTAAGALTGQIKDGKV